MTHTVSEFLYNQDQCHYKQLLMTSETNIKAAQENQGLLKNHRTKIVMATLTGVFILIVVAAVTTAQIFPYPAHASCRINWRFGKSCDEVRSQIIQQMKIWEPRDNCQNGGEKCLYKFLSSEGDMVKGTHTTPVKAYVDDLSFKFTSTPSNTCNVEGFSTSQTWYAVLDYGTNYCNLHNLVDGAGLNKGDATFIEETQSKVCTQYESADCEVY
ncbi:uncharacterized protein LOC136026360 isoform X2 [Artemia franciscana]|uniref:uncharacterized protein LOC136026360 isoform X2 n=1 Tax=Artemia franciscana TaxID=6661 RepID=UPI0032D9F07F